MRSESDVKIRVDFQVTVEGRSSQSFKSDIQEILQDLGLFNKVQIE